jgi:RimJ/RimL family protein N-acetyltransferase
VTGPLPEAVLETERLILRPYVAGDAPDVKLACTDPVTRRWIPLPDPYDDEVARSWVTDLSHRARRAGTGAMFAVVARSTRRLVAGFGLHGVSERDSLGEIGYWVAPWARGNGYATEAARRLARYGFDELGLGRVEILVEPANAASHRVAVRAGCTYEGLRVSAGRHGDRRVDLAAWRLLPDDPYPAARLLPAAGERSDGVVTVRPARPEDAEGAFAERSDPVYARWLPTNLLPTRSVEQVGRHLEEAEWRWLSGQAAAFAVIDMATGEYAGNVTIRPTLPAWGVAAVSYAAHPAFRGRGLLRRALPMVSRWAFVEAGLARLEAGVATGNLASTRVAEAAGFRREGVRRSLQPLPGERTDQIMFSLLPGDLT